MQNKLGQMHKNSSNSTQADERPLTGTGAYNIAQQLQNMELGDSDNYSDDFYSDEFEQEDNEDNQQKQDYEDREDDDFAFDSTVQK